LNFLGFSTWEILLILIVPLIIEVPQVAGKSILLPLHELLYKPLSAGGKRENSEGKFTPKVSVIVPARNEGEHIQSTLESLLESDYPNMEVIVVDDGSTDDTYLKASHYATKPNVKVVRRNVASGSKARAICYGMLFTRGEIIIVVDGDTIVERNSIKELVKPLIEDSRVVGVAGNVKVLNRRSLLTKLQAYEYMVSMELGRRWQGLISGILVIPGAFGAFRREVLESLGRMHSDTITEDFDLTVMLQKTRGRLMFSPKAVAWTYAPEDWRKWIRQRIRWSAGQFQVYRKHSDVFFKRRLGLFGWIIAPNNVFMDMAALFIRVAWLTALITFTPITSNLSYAARLSTLIFTFYLTLEALSLFSATLLSQRREDLKYFLLAPLMVAFYRPLHSTIRLTAYVKAMLKMTVKW
jgi:cellulose synthase/poly-beta-1,6-N-acetylglucosamine synthase-like glycosyltransferase